MKRILFKSLSTPVGYSLLEICILSADYPPFMNKNALQKSCFRLFGVHFKFEKIYFLSVISESPLETY